jgi:hypothetical protein
MYDRCRVIKYTNSSAIGSIQRATKVSILLENKLVRDHSGQIFAGRYQLYIYDAMLESIFMAKFSR